MGPNRVHNPNGTSIGSAVLAQLTAESPHTYIGLFFPSKLSLPMGVSGPPSNTWFLAPTALKIARSHGGSRPQFLPGPTLVLNPNGISISPAIFAQTTAERPYTLQWDVPSSLKIAPSHRGIWTPI